MAEVEHTIKVLPIDSNLEASVKALEAEGWELVPGVTPIAVYHIVRVKRDAPPASVGGQGVIRLDDTKVHIVRDGKLVTQ